MAYVDKIRLTPEELQQAQDYVRARAYNSAFLSKMAELGFPAANEDEARTLLDIDQQCQQVEVTRQPRNRYKKAATKLAPRVSATRQDQTEQDQAIKLAEVLAAQDPDLYASALGCRVEFERQNNLI